MKQARHWIVRGGYLLTLATLAWVILELVRHEGLAQLGSIANEHAWLLLLLLVAYAFASMFQALGWWRLMRICAGQAAPGISIGIFALTQLGKYLPGNVMHFVFRYALTRAAGAPRAAVISASGLEPWILLCAALVLLAVLGGGNWPAHFGWPGWLAWLLPATALSCLAIVLPWLRRRLPEASMGLTDLLPILLLQTAFLLASAALFALVLQLIAEPTSLPITVVLAASVLAWLAGFVTPGSPGGLGVREVVLTLALSGWVEPAAAVSAAAAFRMLTVGGDLLVFAAGSGWWLYRGRSQLISYRRYLQERDRCDEPR